MAFAMMIADGSRKGKADQAFPAHTDVAQHWAQAVWNQWMLSHMLQASLSDVTTRTAEAANPWLVVYGPAAALVCTLKRVGWHIECAVILITDNGRRLDLRADPPTVVARQMDEAVRRWRWRTIAEKHASLPPEGANFDPLYKLINSKKNDQNGGPAFVGELKSVVANRHSRSSGASRLDGQSIVDACSVSTRR